MNRKSLMGMALAAVVTLSSTSIVAFAKTNAGARTITKAAGSLKAKEYDTKLKIDNLQAIKGTDDEAIQVGKEYIQKYMGVNIDEKIKQDGLESDVFRFTDGDDPTIQINFEPDFEKAAQQSNANLFSEQYGVMISLKDGTIYALNAWGNNIEMKQNDYDDEKAKAAAQAFFNKLGVGDGITAMTIDTEKVKAGICGVVAKYSNGTSAEIELSTKDYTIVNYSMIGR